MFKLFFLICVTIFFIGSAGAEFVYDVMEVDDLTVNVTHSIPLKIYLPPGHSTEADPYRVYIFLHGGAGDNYNYSSGIMWPVLDDLINTGAIEPMVVVWPNVQWPGVPGPDGRLENFLNIHMYTDSSRNGDYDSIISTDLLNWLKTPTQHAISYNLSLDPDDYAIGGFSMGAAAAVRFGARHHDKFVACVSHSGAMAYQALRSELSYLLGEYPGGPDYAWDPSAGWNSTWWFGAASAFLPNPNGNLPAWGIDFPVDTSTGDLIPEIFDDRWIANHDAIELYKPLKIPGHEPGEYEIPVGLYFDVRFYGPNKLYTDQFDSELVAEGIVGYDYNVWPSGGHQLQADAVEAGLRFVDEAMDQGTTSGVPSQSGKFDLIILKQNFPNPFNPTTTIRFDLPKEGYVVLSVYDVGGRRIETLVQRNMPAGIHEITWDANRNASGLYTYVLEAFGQRLSKQMLLVK